MVKSTNRSGGGRQGRPSKTIDLEATPKKDVSSDDVINEAEKLSNDIDGPLEKDDGAKKKSDASNEAPKAPVKKGGTSIPAMAISALLGGGVALAGSSYLPALGLMGGSSDNSAEVAALNSEISDLKTRLDEFSNASSDSSAALPALSERLAALETQVSSASTQSGDNSVNSDTIAAALSAAEAASTKSDEVAKQLAALNEKIVEGAGADTVDMGALKAALSGETKLLDERIGALESAAQEAPSNETSEKLTGLEASISKLPEMDKKLEAMNGSIASLEVKTEAFAETLTSFETRFSGLETSVNEKILPSMNEVEKAAGAAIESQKVARSVSARALDTALEQGGRFRGELASAEALIGGTEAISNLKDLAQRGVKTQAELISDFDPVANRMLALNLDTQTDTSVFGKFMASAKSLVKVRSATPIDGDSTAAIVSRIDAELKTGDLAKVLSEWNALPEEAKFVSKDWVNSVRERQTASELIRTVIGELSADQSDQG